MSWNNVLPVGVFERVPSYWQQGWNDAMDGEFRRTFSWEESYFYKQMQKGYDNGYNAAVIKMNEQNKGE